MRLLGGVLLVFMHVYGTDVFECMLYESNQLSCGVTLEEACNGKNGNPNDRNDDNINPELYIASLGHHGLGNQLFQHSFALMLARFYGVPDERVVLTKQTYVNDGTGKRRFVDSNTNASAEVVRMLHPAMAVTSLSVLPPTHPCSTYYSDKDNVKYGNDVFFPRSVNATRERYHNITRTRHPACLKLWGFFQHVQLKQPPFLCPDMVTHYWQQPMYSWAKANAQMQIQQEQAPSSNDMSIYLRCSFSHYVFEDGAFYSKILNGTSYNKLFIFLAPECHHVDHKHNWYGRYSSVLGLLRDTYKGVVYTSTQTRSANAEEEAETILTDFVHLVATGKLVLPASTWAMWAALLTKAKEVHVRIAAKSGWPVLLPLQGPYVYHDSDTGRYFGRVKAGDDSGVIVWPTDDGDGHSAESNQTSHGAV